MENKQINKWISQDKNIKGDMINKMVDLLDDAIMKCYFASFDEEKENSDVTNYNVEHPSTNYYEAMLKVIHYFLDEVPLHIDEDAQKEIDDILEAFRLEVEENGLNTEEIRKALFLLDIKAFKNLNFSLDILTPESIGMIFSKLLNAYFETSNKVTIFDPNFGIGNLMFTIQNHAHFDAKMIGMENHELLAKVAVAKANMMMEDLTLYYQDALEYVVHDVDAVVSDLAEYEYENPKFDSELYKKGIKYFPYLAIEHDLLNLEPHISFYLINNRFFANKDSKVFNDYLYKIGRIECLIILPISMFQSPEDAKSIIVLTNAPLEDSLDAKEMHAFMLPSLNDTKKFIEKLQEIEIFLKELKERKK